MVRCDSQDPLWNMHRGVHRPDRPHLWASVKGAQEGTCARRDQPICSGSASSGRDAWHSVVVRHSCRQSPHFHQLRCTLEAWPIWSQDNTMNRNASPLPSVYNPLIHRTNPAKWLGNADIFTLPHSSFYPWILGTDLLYVLVTVFDFPPIHFLISHLRPFHPASAFPPSSFLPPALKHISAGLPCFVIINIDEDPWIWVETSHAPTSQLWSARVVSRIK